MAVCGERPGSGPASTRGSFPALSLVGCRVAPSRACAVVERSTASVRRATPRPSVHSQKMSGRGKGKTGASAAACERAAPSFLPRRRLLALTPPYPPAAKKAVSRSAKAGLQFPVGRIGAPLLLPAASSPAHAPAQPAS